MNDSKVNVEFTIGQKFTTTQCKKCDREFLIFSILRESDAPNKEHITIMGPLVNDIHCPMCGEK